MIQRLLGIGIFFLSLNSFAQGTQPKPNIIESLVPFILIFAVFYFLIIRPQSKQRKKQMKVLSELKKGDQVITTGGILGQIDGLTEKFVTLGIDEGVQIKILRSQIHGLAKEEQPQN